MSKVLVIGNGFDIALGLYSKYSNFVNAGSTIEHAFWPFRDEPSGEFANSSLYRHFYDYYNSHKDDLGNILWIDIESELLRYAKSKVGKPVDTRLAEYDEYHFEFLKMMLQKYFSIVTTLERPNPQSKFVKLISAIKANADFKKVYSFNYTDLTEELISFLGFRDEEVPEVVYVHGKPDPENLSNIVLGINEDLSIPEEYHFLFKSKQAHPTDLARDMALADEVIFYGLSLGEIDFPYFKSFFNYVASQSIIDPKKHISIFTFGKNCVAAIDRSIHAMGVKIHDLKEKSYFNVIDMDNLILPGYDETAYNNIIERLNGK